MQIEVMTSFFISSVNVMTAKSLLSWQQGANYHDSKEVSIMTAKK